MMKPVQVAMAALALYVLGSHVQAQYPVSLAPAVSYAVGAGAWDPYAVAIGDVNGDGIPDLAIANNHGNNPGTVSIRLGTGTGTFGGATNFAAGIGPDFVALGDFDMDGRADLAVANHLGHDVSILRNTNTVNGGLASFGFASGRGTPTLNRSRPMSDKLMS